MTGPWTTPASTLDADQRLAAKVMFDAVLAACGADDLALLQEGHVKHIAVKACLTAGYTLREGAHSGGDWELKLSGGAFAAQKIARASREEGAGSRDVRIEAPTRLHVELKCFGEVGAKDHFDRGSNGFRGDLDRVRTGHAQAFLCAVAGKLYSDARGDKTEKRGRPAHDGHVLSFLPQRESIPIGIAGMFDAADGNNRFVIWAGRVRTPTPALAGGSGDRVVLLVALAAPAPEGPA